MHKFKHSISWQSEFPIPTSTEYVLRQGLGSFYKVWKPSYDKQNNLVWKCVATRWE